MAFARSNLCRREEARFKVSDRLVLFLAIGVGLDILLFGGAIALLEKVQATYGS